VLSGHDSALLQQKDPMRPLIAFDHHRLRILGCYTPKRAKFISARPGSGTGNPPSRALWLPARQRANVTGTVPAAHVLGHTRNGVKPFYLSEPEKACPMARNIELASHELMPLGQG
jgi:hypothetical protein